MEKGQIMRIPVDIYHHVPTKYKSAFKLVVNKVQYLQLLEGKDLCIKGRFRLFKKRENIVFAPIFMLGEDSTILLGVKHEDGGLKYLPRHNLSR